MMKIILVLLLLVTTASCASPSSERPSVEDAPLFARWLVSQGSWGVLATLTGSAPFGYVVSYADAGSGVPYFYLSPLDPAGRNADIDPRACFTLSERAVDGCVVSDPQSPSCAKISLSGQLVMVPPETAGAKALFQKHPQLNRFPKVNGTFSVFKLEIQDVFLVNKPAQRRDVTVADYLGVMI